MTALLPDDDSPEAVAYRLQRYGIRARPGDPNLHSGGMVHGSDPTSDTVRARLSAGCWVTPFEPTAVQRAVLEAINAGEPFTIGEVV